MKRLISIILLAALVLTLSACGNLTEELTRIVQDISNIENLDLSESIPAITERPASVLNESGSEDSDMTKEYLLEMAQTLDLYVFLRDVRENPARALMTYEGNVYTLNNVRVSEVRHDHFLIATGLDATSPELRVNLASGSTAQVNRYDTVSVVGKLTTVGARPQYSMLDSAFIIESTVMSKDEMLAVAQEFDLEALRRAVSSNPDRAFWEYEGNVFILSYIFVSQITLSHIVARFMHHPSHSIRIPLDVETIAGINLGDTITVVGELVGIRDLQNLNLRNAFFMGISEFEDYFSFASSESRFTFYLTPATLGMLRNEYSPFLDEFLASPKNTPDNVIMIEVPQVDSNLRWRIVSDVSSALTRRGVPPERILHFISPTPQTGDSYEISLHFEAAQSQVQSVTILHHNRRIGDFTANVGDRMTFTVRVEPIGSDAEIIWESSNEDVFVILPNAEGTEATISATGRGTANLTVTAGRVTSNPTIVRVRG